jgi:hypothetical protein
VDVGAGVSLAITVAVGEGWSVFSGVVVATTGTGLAVWLASGGAGGAPVSGWPAQAAKHNVNKQNSNAILETFDVRDMVMILRYARGVMQQEGGKKAAGLNRRDCNCSNDAGRNFFSHHTATQA